MPSSRRRTVCLVGCVLCWVLAALAVGLPAAVYAQASGKARIRLESGVPASVVLPARQQYGIYFDDTDNSGYDEDCTVEDGTAEVELRDPGWSTSSSDTENLDIVFNTGTGHLTLDCSSSAERITVKPDPRIRTILAGALLALVLGAVGLVLLLARRDRSARPGLPVLPPAAWYPDPQQLGRLRYWDGRAWTEHVTG